MTVSPSESSERLRARVKHYAEELEGLQGEGQAERLRRAHLLREVAELKEELNRRCQ